MSGADFQSAGADLRAGSVRRFGAFRRDVLALIANADSGPPSGVTETEPDYRFTLANERTFLAYIRTAIALDGAGLAVVQFLTSVGSHRGRLTIGILLVVAGLATTISGFYRWRSVQTAMRRGLPLPSSGIPRVLTIVLAVSSIAAAIALAVR